MTEGAVAVFGQVMLPIAFDVILVICCAYTFKFGGRTGRWCVALITLTIMLTIIAAAIDSPRDRVTPMMVVADATFLLGLVLLSFKSNRRWPIWMAAFQLNCVLAHAVGILSPKLIGSVYYAMATIWGIPTLLVMVIGTTLDIRHERNARLVSSGEKKVNRSNIARKGS